MTRMRLARQRNQLGNAFVRKTKKPRAGGGKRKSMWIMSAMVAALTLFVLLTMSRMALLNMQCRLVAGGACAQAVGAGHELDLNRAVRDLHAAAFDPALLGGLSMALTALFAIAVLLPLAGKELATPDWDLEWLVTLPVARSTLLWGRLVERSASNLPGLFALFPAYAMIAWYSGYRWSAAPIALLATALLLPLAALLHTLTDTGVRLWLATAQLRNLQALLSLCSAPLLYMVFALAMPGASTFVMDWARGFPAWGQWLPPGVLLQAIQAPDLGRCAALAALLVVQLVTLLWLGVALMRRQLRHGVVGSGVRESGRAPVAAAAGGSQQELRWRLPLSPVMRRELRLLARDRNFLVQTLVLPVVLVGSQLVFNGKVDTIAHFGDMPTVAAAIAFGIGVYVLMLSAFQTLNNEGSALWLLYTVPQSVERVLKEKARLWSVLALIYPLAVGALTLATAPAPTWQMLVLLLIVLAGIPIYSTIAVALGVFACDPTAVEVHRRIRPTYSYLYLLLAGFYTWSIYTSVWSQKLVVMVLSAALALALWQKARDALPYLLDPHAAPPARVSAADGLIAATGFFIAQALIALLLMTGQPQPSLPAQTMAFGIAGLLVYALMRLIYWRSKTTGVPVIVRGTSWWPSLKVAALPAALACAVALAYLHALKLWQVPLPATPGLADALPHARLWMAALAVVSAPLCEEFIFRGLIYGGLRRSLPAWQAIAASAAIFAVVHPPLSMLPVFVLGCCAAWTYERSKTLLAPMLVHAAYNMALLAVQ